MDSPVFVIYKHENKHNLSTNCVFYIFFLFLIKKFEPLLRNLFGSKLNGTSKLGIGGLDDASELGGDSLDATGDLGDKLVLRGELADGSDASFVVEDPLHGSAPDSVALLLLELLGKSVKGLDGASDVFVDEEPHVGALGQIVGAIISRPFEGAGHELVLDHRDGGPLGEGSAELLRLGNGKPTGGADEYHLCGFEALLEACDTVGLAGKGGRVSASTSHPERRPGNTGLSVEDTGATGEGGGGANHGGGGEDGGRSYHGSRWLFDGTDASDAVHAFVHDYP